MYIYIYIYICIITYLYIHISSPRVTNSSDATTPVCARQCFSSLMRPCCSRPGTLMNLAKGKI